ncbi:hypothetical protein [Terasakiella sp. SH-1]|uniref:hypothetical protein n=1 Tax=Terasakiella sp. SH-1 TaxID=2560057 RepID=UPI001073491E|nr:hypothetical protein [Terasakiella sp. SH-1]
MDLLLVISSAEATRIAAPLGEACVRADLDWGCFFTGDGVKTLADEAFSDLVASSCDEAVVCAEAWKVHMTGLDCPVDVGSQFHHSGLVAKADKVVSL